MTLNMSEKSTDQASSWEFKHEGTTFRLVSPNGAERVELYWLHGGQPVSRGTRNLHGRSAKAVAATWAGEITGQPVVVS